MELMCKAKTLLYFDEILYVYYREQNTSTTDNYSVKKALDFLTQTLEYLNLADKYKDKKDALIKRIEKEGYIDKVQKLEDWIIMISHVHIQNICIIKKLKDGTDK